MELQVYWELHRGKSDFCFYYFYIIIKAFYDDDRIVQLENKVKELIQQIAIKEKENEEQKQDK